ncbi:MAG: alpha/beta fold hydrolase [Aureispira sp.]|nr:alpha/beta fold hydrolase [Aureispira sp.]
MKNRAIYILWALALVSLLTACKKEAQPDDIITIRNEGGDMPAYIFGNKDSKTFIVLLHGGPGGSGLEYRFGQFSRELEADYAMVYWDQRGQGQAHGHYKSDQLTVDLMVEDLHKLILTLKHQYGEDISVFLMGHSWGGLLGTAYMVTDYQKELKGWIEVDGAHDYVKNDPDLVQMFKTIGSDQITRGIQVEEWQPILDFVNTIDVNNINYDQSVQLNQYGHKAEGFMREVKEPAAENSINYRVDGLISELSGGVTNSTLTKNGLDNISFTNDLHKITTPSLILWGTYDFVVPPSLAVDAMNLIGTSDKEMVLFDQSGHSPMANEPDKFLQVTNAFIEKYK